DLAKSTWEPYSSGSA
ncbi:unnamed protein product, partial [Oikopleura dioica]